MLKKIIDELSIKVYNWYYGIQPNNETIEPIVSISQKDNYWNKLGLLFGKKPQIGKYTQSQLDEYKSLLGGMWEKSSYDKSKPKIEEPKRIGELELIIQGTN